MRSVCERARGIGQQGVDTENVTVFTLLMTNGVKVITYPIIASDPRVVLTFDRESVWQREEDKQWPNKLTHTDKKGNISFK